jgi:hypothetical protein
MKLSGIHLPGWRLDKHNQLVCDAKHLDVSARLRQRASKRVRLAPPPSFG